MRKLLLAFFCLFTIVANATPIDELLERIDKGASKKFKIELRQSANDFFELDQAGGKVMVRGNSWVNIATGINWYLKYNCGIHLTWGNMKAQLPAALPKVKAKERHETNMKMRYCFNYCTFSYSMAFWDWQRWQEEIDWMALHGVNMPLAIVGTECVWRNMLLKMGYSEDEVGEFIAGPAFLAWWEMNNLEGWGGPLPMSWYRQQEALQKNILKRMKQLGMEPVLPGYSGMMPHDAKQKLGLDVSDGGTWNGYVRPSNLMPTDKRFGEVADAYYAELTKLYGKSKYYSMDPFHESNDDATIDYAKAGKAVMDAMKRTNKEAKWVVQGWTENPRQQMMADLKNGDIVILDLFSECRPMFGIPSIWKRENGYDGHSWMFCMLENFGGNIGLHGRMDQLLNNYKLARNGKWTQTMTGTGFTMEGTENNPVMFELMSELPWLADVPTKEQWVKKYIVARYGKHDADIEKAWMILAESIYNCPLGNNQQGPHESIFCGRPGLNNFQVKSWSKMRNYYDPENTKQAARLMLAAADRMKGNDNYLHDLVDITRQALADKGRRQYLKTIADYNAFARKDFRKDADRFLKMIMMQDSLLGTRSEFRLGRWTQQARNLGNTAKEKEQYEWNARVQITTWGNRVCADKGGLRDYANKEWQGLLKDFYYNRWKIYFDALEKQMADDTKPNYEALGGGKNANKTSSELFAMALPHGPEIDWYAIEEPWTLQHNQYSAKAVGNAVEMARMAMKMIADGEKKETISEVKEIKRQEAYE